MNKFSVQLKVVTGIIAILAVSVSVSLLISITNQRNNLLDSTRRNLITNNDMLNTLVRNMMLDGEAPLVVGTLADIKQLPGFEELEIYRRTGTLAFSDYSTLEEVNAYQDRIAFEQTPRQEVKTIANDTFRQVVMSNTPKHIENLEEQRMSYYFPILNYQNCRECHGSDHFVRGVAFYRVSLSRMFEQITASRNTLILFFAGTGVLIAIILIFVLRGIVLIPIMRIGEVVTAVGEGDLEVRSDIRTQDELGMLSQKINSMIVGLEEKSTLEVQNRVIEARNQENRKYLDNIREGLLLINRDYTISEQYSIFLEQLFATDRIAGVPFVDFLFPDGEKYVQEREELHQFLSRIFEKTQTSMEMIMSINPLADKTLTIETEEGKKQIVIDTDFLRIFDDSGSVENVMVIFEDNTDIVQVQRELELERKRSESELEQIQAILKIGPQSFIEFEDDATNAITRIEDRIDSFPAETRLATSTLNTMMREFHSLKGTARYLEFRRVSELSHQAESVISDVLSGERQWDNSVVEELRSTIQEIRNELRNIDRINETFKDFAVQITSEKTERSDLETFLANLKKMTEDMAVELEKEVEVTVESSILQDFPHLTRLRNAIIHLARNAVDHGIEDEIERISNGKEGTAHIRFRFDRKDGSYTIIIEDDGRGIDFSAIRKKAIEKGILSGNEKKQSDRHLLNLLFRPDFSTREKVSELSGRGVGLDAVHEDVKNLGGRISVFTKKGSTTRFTIIIPEERQ